VTARIAELERSLEHDPEPPGRDRLDEPAAAPPPVAAPTPVAPTPAPSLTPAQSDLTVATAPPPKKSHKAAWIAVGVVAGVLVIGGAVAIGLTQAVHNDNGYNNWGTLVVNGH